MIERLRVAILVAVGCGGYAEPPPQPELEQVPPVRPQGPAWGVPISGGNLIITADGARAVIADADRDRVIRVDLATGASWELALPAHSEPGRLIEDGDGRIHVALRRSGELLTLTGDQPVVRPVCGEPRGLAWDARHSLVHIACATGELVSIAPDAITPTRVARLDRDLRDVIVHTNGLTVTRFRTAEVLEIDRKGAIVSRTPPPITQRLDIQGGGGELHADPGKVDATPDVAWRTIVLPDGTLVMAHQRKNSRPLSTFTGGYGTMCGGGPVEAAITTFSPQGGFAAAPIIKGALPVDVAFDPISNRLAVVVAGNNSVQTIDAAWLALPDDDECGDSSGQGSTVIRDTGAGIPTSVAFTPSGELVIYYPEAPMLVIRDSHGARAIALSGGRATDSGRSLFHAQTPVGSACASCHPDGRDDGQVWMFDELGPRRTQSLAGGIASRAPYHWSGDMADLGTLMDQVFTTRMLGEPPTPVEVATLAQWLDRIPAPKGVVVDEHAVQRGESLFLSLNCKDCHAGQLATNNRLVDVGTGGMFKVPSLLGVGARAPFLHDGCAATLVDRFTCGGDRHGNASQLTAVQLADLVAYLDAI